MLPICAWVYGHWQEHWQPGATLPRKTDSPYPPPITPAAINDFSPRDGMSGVLSYWYWSVDWLDLMQVLCKQPQLLRAHEYSSSIMSKRYCFAAGLPNLRPFQSFYTMVLPEEGEEDAKCGVCGWVFHSLLFDQLWVSILIIIHR